MAIDPRNYDLDELRGVTTPDPEESTVSTDAGGETAFVWGPTRAEGPHDATRAGPGRRTGGKQSQ
ncbi:MAG: hypothetical protein ABEJ82_02980 [Haloplanus sp.]